MRKWYKNQLVPWLFPVLMIVLWQILGQFNVISSSILPTPLEVLDAAVELTISGKLQDHVLISTQRALIGFLIGGIIGFILGLLNGTIKIFERTVDTTIQMIRTIPHLALIPLVILWFGIGESAKIFLVALGVMFPVYINTFSGIQNVDRKLIEMGKVYGLSNWELFANIILPGAPVFHFGRHPLRSRRHVDVADCSRNDWHGFGNRLPGDECPRIYANGHRRSNDRSLCHTWKTVGCDRENV